MIDSIVLIGFFFFFFFLFGTNLTRIQNAAPILCLLSLCMMQLFLKLLFLFLYSR